MVYEPTFNCRVVYINDGGNNVFQEEKLYKNGYVSNFNSRTVSAKDTLLLIIGKVDDESRKVIMADTVYCFSYVEK